MPGTISENRKNRDPDILFDLTIDDNNLLSDSDLLSLVNYGQLRKPVDVPGMDGRTHKIEMALLWDEDYVDMLKRTTKYASDPLLRLRLTRRLKLHKAIQRIDDVTFDDPSDTTKQRILWTLLNRMADINIEYLDAKYTEMETERNIRVNEDIASLSDRLNSTSPLNKKENPQVEPKAVAGTPAAEAPAAEGGPVSHEEFIKKNATRTESPDQGTFVKSPKQTLDSNG